MRRGEQNRSERETDYAAKKTFDHIIEEKTKDEFLDDGSDCYRENDDDDSLVNGSRFAERLDDILPARTPSKESLRNDVGPQNEWIAEEQEDGASAEGAKKRDSGKTA